MVMPDPSLIAFIIQVERELDSQGPVAMADMHYTNTMPGYHEQGNIKGVDNKRCFEVLEHNRWKA